MQYSTIVDKDEQGLIQIIEAAKKFEEDRFLEGIHQRCYTALDIQVATDRWITVGSPGRFFDLLKMADG